MLIAGEHHWLRLRILGILNSYHFRHRGQSSTSDFRVDSKLSYGSELIERIGASHDERAMIGPLLPLERGRGDRPAKDNARYLEGRDGHATAAIADGYACGTERSDATGAGLRRRVNFMLESLDEAVERDTSADMIGSTVVRAQDCAVRLKSMQDAQVLGCFRGGLDGRARLSLSTRSTPLASGKADRSALSVRLIRYTISGALGLCSECPPSGFSLVAGRGKWLRRPRYPRHARHGRCRPLYAFLPQTRSAPLCRRLLHLSSLLMVDYKTGEQSLILEENNRENVLPGSGLAGCDLTPVFHPAATRDRPLFEGPPVSHPG